MSRFKDASVVLVGKATITLARLRKLQNLKSVKRKHRSNLSSFDLKLGNFLTPFFLLVSKVNSNNNAMRRNLLDPVDN